MNLILNVEAIRFLDRLDIDMKKKKGRKEEKKRANRAGPCRVFLQP